MYSGYEVEGYVFDTAALKDAVQEIDYSGAENEAETDSALLEFTRVFCDWAPEEHIDSKGLYDYINTEPQTGLEGLEQGEQEAHFEIFTEQLAENLREQYGLDVSQQDLKHLGYALVEEIDDSQYDFMIKYLSRFANKLESFDPRSGGDIQNMLDQTRSLPSQYLDTKRRQYKGKEKINTIRQEILERFHQPGDVSIDEIEEVKQQVANEYDKEILRAWRNYTILGQIYIDFFKHRIDYYLEKTADRLTREFDLELETFTSSFQGSRNQLGSYAWLCLYTPPKDTYREKHQLYVGFKPGEVSFGVHVGEERRDGEWEQNRDLQRMTVEEVTLQNITDKFSAVEDDFLELEGRTPREPVEKPSDADDIARQLESKKQVVFYGPPGTGKTYVAERFARWWTAEQDVEAPAQDRVETVTFHPSFTYEDFIEGLSAESTETGVDYSIEDGILKRISRRAKDDLQATEEGEEPPRYVLIIDEINRGNIAQIFGETITLLEADKRGKVTTQLAHSDEPFTIPSNLYVIGTMNTADRSISLVDAALRRRFRFLPFPPDMQVLTEHHDMDGLEGTVELATQGEDSHRVLLALSILAIDQINDKILNSPDLGKGKQIGHSYLMDVEDTTGLVDTWKYDVLPLLEEYYFGQFDRIRQDIFGGTGGDLVDWNQERINDFDANALLQTLEELVDVESALNRVSTEADGGNVETSSGSRTGPEYVETEPELYDDLDEKLESGSITEEEYEAFDELYSFAKEVGDRVAIGGAKNANFEMRVDAHQGDYTADPSVFTGNVNGKVKIWPAKRPISKHEDPDGVYSVEGEYVNWPSEAYQRFVEGFRELPGVPPGESEADFADMVREGSIEEFKELVREFVEECRAAEDT